jgi:uncharacterized protein with GYD domain
MPKYVILMKMTEQGSKDIRNAPERIENGIKLLEKMGGKLIGFYLVMGEYDYVGIGECPSDEAATAFALVAPFITVGCERKTRCGSGRK